MKRHSTFVDKCGIVKLTNLSLTNSFSAYAWTPTRRPRRRQRNPIAVRRHTRVTAIATITITWRVAIGTVATAAAQTLKNLTAVRFVGIVLDYWKSHANACDWMCINENITISLTFTLPIPSANVWTRITCHQRRRPLLAARLATRVTAIAMMKTIRRLAIMTAVIAVG